MQASHCSYTIGLGRPALGFLETSKDVHINLNRIFSFQNGNQKVILLQILLHFFLFLSESKKKNKFFKKVLVKLRAKFLYPVDAKMC